MILSAVRHVLSGDVIPGIGNWRWTGKHLRRVAVLLVDPWTQLKVMRALWRREVRPIMSVAPFMIFKYLTEYVGTGLSRKERASILVHHYTLLSDRAHGRFFRRIVDDRIQLWERVVGERAYKMFLTFPRETHVEGDLALIFRADGTDIYTLAFTIGPGSIIGLDARHVMYVARVQGKGAALDLIREASRDCLTISPASLLLVAADGLAEELGIGTIVGVNAETQLSAERSQRDHLVTAYDGFWETMGGQKLKRDLFQLTVPIAEKPIEEVRSCHRNRVRKRRELKQLVRDEVRLTLREAGVGQAASSIAGEAWPPKRSRAEHPADKRSRSWTRGPISLSAYAHVAAYK